MKSIILIAAFAVASAAASIKGYGPVLSAPALIAAGPISTGSSSQFRSQDNLGNTNFGYDESHATGATSRREEIVNGVVRGSYSLSDADGRRRVVNYIADDAGFRANVQTNEPGVEPKDPADVLINKSAPVAVAVAAPAPLPAPLPVAAPAPLPAPLPAPIAGPVPVWQSVKGIARVGPALVAPAAPAIVEVPTPQAFSYNIGVQHLSAPRPVAVAAAPIPTWAPTPIVQQQQTIDY